MGDSPLVGNGQSAMAEGEPGRCGATDTHGGRGGDAYARGGDGGLSPQGTGGNGGNATAHAGTGGRGADACFKTTRQAERSGIHAAGSGGYSGIFHAFGGRGRNGTFGGAGGAAFGWNQGADGGNASAPIKPGEGGVPDPKGRDEAEAGDGGKGVLGGGGGGGAGGYFLGGRGGGYCSTSTFDAASLGASSLVLVLTLLPLAIRRRRP
jgi:hypothetical protein